MAEIEQAPYGPSASVVRVLETYRETGLGGAAIDTALMIRMGMGDEIARRVVQTFRLLGLIDDKGKPTETLVAFKQAPTEDYKAIIAGVLFDVYAPVFAVTGRNLAEKSTVQIEDAFRPYKPDSLRKRMVSLFLGLCQYAEILPKRPASPAPRSNGQAAPRKTAAKKAASHHSGKPADPEPPSPPVDPARERYIGLLIAKAEAQEDPPAELLDRIERALGIPPAADGRRDSP